jgi:hypothetical protein
MFGGTLDDLRPTISDLTELNVFMRLLIRQVRAMRRLTLVLAFPTS